jgi:hypothetical protein
VRRCGPRGGDGRPGWWPEEAGAGGVPVGRKI